MSTSHGHPHGNAHPVRQSDTDPSGTARIQAAYYDDIESRYKRVRTAVVRSIADADVFGMDDSSGFEGFIDDPPAPSYSYPMTASGLSAYVRWVRRALNVVVMGSGDPWTEQYIRRSYSRGLSHAAAALRAEGIAVDPGDLADAFATPIHRSTIEIFFRRQYELLDGINSTMAKELQRVLADGFMSGESPRVVGRQIRDKFGSIALRRGEMIARTESVYAMNEAALNRYETYLGGDAEVTAIVEFLTAGDRRVCPECSSLEGQHFKVSEAHGVIPRHPNCRCTWIPVF